MRLVDRKILRDLLKQVDARLQSETELLLVGGSAVLVLCEDAAATKDLDAFPTESLGRLLGAVSSGDFSKSVDVNTSSAAFESYLPEDWQSRIVHSVEFSGRYLQVFTPCPEDLAVMKVFRYLAKDAEDIERLPGLERFNPQIFKERFLYLLPVAIGRPTWHAQSFAMIWNHLYPDAPINSDDLVTP